MTSLRQEIVQAENIYKIKRHIHKSHFDMFEEGPSHSKILWKTIIFIAVPNES